MARKLSETGKGHNSTVILDDDDRAALQLRHSLDIRRKRAAADKAKAIYDEARSEVNGSFALLKGDLGISRKEMEEVLALQDLSESEFVAAEARRHSLLVNQGLPVGTQLEMFGSGDTVDDQRLAYLDGQRAGRRGDHGVPPEKIATYLHPNWQEGWNDGVAENAPKLARAAAIMEARAAAASHDDDSDRDDEAAGEDGDDDFDPAELERRLKSSDFMQTADKEPPSYDPLVVNGVRYATKKLANEARATAEREAADARDLQAAE